MTKDSASYLIKVVRYGRGYEGERQTINGATYLSKKLESSINQDEDTEVSMKLCNYQSQVKNANRLVD